MIDKIPVIATIHRLLYLSLAVFILSISCVFLTVSSPHKALALGNVFIVTILGDSQPPGFTPDLLTVHVYDTVVFVNSTSAPIAIATTDNSFSSPAIVPGKLWKVTFNSMGAFEYHENSSAPRAFGEIVVVPDTVALLPSPAPAAQETAIAYIQAGKAPPDTLWQQVIMRTQTEVAVSPSKKETTHTLSITPLTFLLSFARVVILVVIVLCALFAVGLGGRWLYRRWQSRKEEEEEDDDDDE